MKKYLVFDIGGTFVKWAIVDEKYKIIENAKWRFEGKTEGKTVLVRKMGEKVQEIEAKEKIAAIGISTAGIVDPKTFKLVGESFNIKGMSGCDFAKELKKYTKVKVYVENDANAAVMGESTSKQLSKYKNLLMITLGTGIGAGVIINGNIYRGGSGMAGEIGHQLYNGERWEYFYSAIGLLRLVKERNGVEMSTYEILESKDKKIKATLDAWYTGIAHVLASINTVMNFEALVIGGGISESPLFDLKLIDKKIKEHLPQKQFHGTYKLYRATMGNNAAVLGMAKVINTAKK